MKAKKKHFVYLDALRESGITNMHGAVPYLMNAFDDLCRKDAGAILIEWKRTFAERRRLLAEAAPVVTIIPPTGDDDFCEEP